MAEMLITAGYQESEQAHQADVIIVNTCGFIQPARKESLRVLREYARKKKKNQRLVAAGCLSERDKNSLLEQVTGLDAVFGTRRWPDILKVMDRLPEHEACPFVYFPPAASIQPPPREVTQAAVQGASAYLKIADGCDRLCSFCAIPHIKGPMVSRPLDDVIRDARIIAGQGIKEIILIAQDTTAYGRDLGISDGLTVLLKELIAAVPQVPWLRIMYAFPGSISDQLIDVMAAHEQVLPYVDLPLQHAHPRILKSMRRPHDINQVRQLITKLRQKMPTLALRTTFIVGYPDESNDEFEVLMDFLKEIRFDHAGFFPYYHEPGTMAFRLPDSVPNGLKQERLHRLAALQEGISLAINRSLLGNELDVLIEGYGDGMSVGRCYRDAPEIDGLVLMNEFIPPGEMVVGRVTGALVHDLIAEKVK